MKPFGPPDTHHLNAAQGWLGLGDHLEANEELEKIAPERRAHPDVLAVRYEIYAKAGNWRACLDIGEAEIKQAPERAGGWLHRAYATRRVEGGGLKAAQTALLPALETAPGNPLVPYNLACYACQLGDLEEAKRLLNLAFADGDQKALKIQALDDPDLEPLWARIGEI